MKKESNEDKEIHLSLTTKELINEENDYTFCSTMLKCNNWF